MKIRAYAQGDETKFVARDPQPVMDPNSAWTICISGNPVAVFGCSEFMLGVGHVWMIVGEEVRGRGVALTKMASTMLDTEIDLQGFHRIQAFVDSRSDENKRWLRLLGLEYESTMAKASPIKTDIDIYARFP